MGSEMCIRDRARPAIFSGVSLVIMETLNDYGAVKHFGIPTLTSGIFRTWMGLNDINSALRLSSYLIIFIVMVLLLEKWLRQGARFDDKSGFKIEFENQKIQTTQYLIPFICCIIPLSLGFLIPVLRLCTWGYENIKVAFNVTFLKNCRNFTATFTIWSSCSTATFTKDYHN